MVTAINAQEPLDRLQTELNSVLFQVGKIFKVAHRGDVKALHQAKTKAKEGIPRAQSQFSDCLDELEKDLTDARTILNRDLAAIRNKRAEREKAAGAARLQNGQTKAVKLEGNASSKPGQKTAPSSSASDAQKTTKTEPGQQQAPGPKNTAIGIGVAAQMNDIDSMFTDDLVGLTGLESAVQPQAAPGQAGPAEDITMSTDALFSDGVINLDETDFGNLGGTGDQDDLQNLLPGLEKYVNQTQDSSAAVNGQNAAAASDEFDLEALLNDMAGGGDNSTSHPMDAAGQALGAKNAKLDDGAKGNKTEAKLSGPAATNANNAPGQGDTGALDFGGNENSFEIDFDELTAGAGDGSALPNHDDLGDWFNFD